MATYILQGIGNNENRAMSRLEKLVGKANKKLESNNLPVLGDPKKTEYSIETRVDEQRRFVDITDFEGAIAQAEEKLGDYSIISYGILYTYSVTQTQLEILQSNGKDKKKSPTAGLDPSRCTESKDISHYLRF